MKPECKTCRFFVPRQDVREIVALAYGQCRFNPPVTMAIGWNNGDGRVQEETRWPQPYSASDTPWCGKHEEVKA